MLQCFPEELLINIVKFLHPLELVRISRINKSFYRICNDPEVWKWKCLQLGYSLSNVHRDSLSPYRICKLKSGKYVHAIIGSPNARIDQQPFYYSWKWYFFGEYHSDIIGSLYRGESIHIQYEQSFDCYAYNAIEVTIRNYDAKRDYVAAHVEETSSPVHLVVEIGLRRDDSNACRFAIDVRTATTLKKWRAVVEELLNFRDPSTSSAGFAHFIQVITLEISKKYHSDDGSQTNNQKIESTSFVYYKQRPLLETVCEYYRQKYEEFQRNQLSSSSSSSSSSDSHSSNQIEVMDL